MAPPRILVVEDDPSIREAVVFALRAAGYVVEEASDGRAALSLLTHTPVTLIVLDMRMPIMNGWEFAQALRAQGRHIPVLVMTAAADAQRWAAEIEAEAVLSKPFEIQALLDEVHHLAGAASLSPG